MSLEYKLALANSGKGYLPADDLTIKRFRYLLDRAAEKTGDTKKEIADYASKGQSVVENEFGKKMSILDFMEKVDRELSSSSAKMSYQDAVLMTLAALG